MSSAARAARAKTMPAADSSARKRRHHVRIMRVTPWVHCEVWPILAQPCPPPNASVAQGRQGSIRPEPSPPRTRDNAMTIIRQDDLIESVAAALQYISYYHPADYIAHLARAYEREESPAAKDAIAQMLTNSRMCAEGHRPICQDTGSVNVFMKIGMDCRFEGFDDGIEAAVNEGVRKGYLNPDNKLRASVLDDPLFARKNTKDNTPAVVHMRVVPGATVSVDVAA